MRIWVTCTAAVFVFVLFACAGPPSVATEPPPVVLAGPPDTLRSADTPPVPPNTAPVADVAVRMTLANGFQMAGSLRGITPDGLVRLTSPLLDGEHAVRLTMLDRIQFAASLPGTGQAVVALTTGDVLQGHVEAITEDSVVFRSASLGTMNLPKAALSDIRWVGKASAVLVTDFSSGRLGAWKPHVGKWFVEDGLLMNTPIRGQNGTYFSSALVAEVDQSQGVTVEVEIDSTNPSAGRYSIFFVQSLSKNGSNRRHVSVKLYSSHLIVRLGGNRKLLVENPLGKRDTPLKGTYRVAWDPKTRALVMWFNGKQIGKCRISGMGKYVLISHGPPVGTRCVRVLPMFEPPVAPQAQARNTFQVFASRGKSFDARAVTMAGGSLTAVTADGEKRLPLAGVARLAFPVAARKALPPSTPSTPSTGSGQAGHMTVDTSDGSLTLKPAVRMTATHLVGTSPVLGAVRVRWAAIQAVHMRGRSAGTPLSTGILPPGSGSTTEQAGADTLTLADGRRFSCRVLSVDERRRLHFEAPWLDGEWVFRGDIPMELHLSGATPEERDLTMIVLTNGDVLAGKQLELAEEDVQFQSQLFGARTLPTSIVAEITHSGGVPKGVGDMTEFAPGHFGSWKPHSGKWSIERGGLTAPPLRDPGLDGTGQPTLIAEVPDQSMGITVEVEVDAVGAGEFRYDIILFADTVWGNECIRVSLVSKGSTSLHVVRKKGLKEHQLLVANLKGLGTPAKPLKGMFRAAFEHRTGVVAVWFNGELIGKCTLDKWPGLARYVMISHHKPVGTRRAWILPKFAPITVVAERKAAPNVFRMLLASGDTFDSPSPTISEGIVRAMTPDGEIRLPLANVLQFILPVEGHKLPPGSGHNAIVQTGRGRLTFKLTALTPEHLVGHSALLGPVKIPRKLVHSLEFLPKGN